MILEELRHIIYNRLKISEKDENIERLTLEQMEFIIQDINKLCYLEACPGSGKTEVVGLKAAFEIIDWKAKFSGMAFLSFTNNASSEIEKRAKKYAGSNATSHPHFIGTLDSFFYKYVLCPFFYRYVGFKGKNGDCSPRAIIDERSEADFLSNIKYHPKTRYAITNPNKKSGANPYVGISISANRYYFDLIKDDFFILPPIANSRIFSTLSDILNRPEQKIYLQPLLNDWLTKDIIIDGFWSAKRTFWGDGFLTFRDSELIILKIIHDKPEIRKKLIKRFPFLIIDECQDLSPIQLVILEYLVKDGLKTYFIGDLNQSIYKFREVKPVFIFNFIKQYHLNPLKLTNNFRSNQQIVNLFCKVFPGSIVGNEKQYLNNCTLLIEYDESEIPKLIKRYQEIINEANKEIINNHKEIKNELIKESHSAIIIRGSALLNKFKPYKTNSKNPLTILAISLYLWNSKKNTESLIQAITLFGCFLSKIVYKNQGNIRNQYCPEGITNTLWRISLANLLNDVSKLLFPFTGKKDENLTFSNWAKIVRKNLPFITSNLPINSDIDITQIKVLAESGYGSLEVAEIVLHYNFGSKIRTTTIHDVKGETLDSVLIVSSLDKKSKGGHWEDWFNTTSTTEDQEEHKRYGYVALSRPKHLLVMAVPKLNATDRTIFTEFGFQIENLKSKAIF